MRTEAQRKAARAYYERNKERLLDRSAERYKVKKEAILAQQRDRYKEFRKEILAKNKEWRENNKDKVKLADKSKYIWSRYSMSIDDFQMMWTFQQGKCANEFCGKNLEETKSGYAIDHSHTTGKVRGLLCRACNVSLGHMNDDIRKLQGLINYILKYGV